MLKSPSHPSTCKKCLFGMRAGAGKREQLPGAARGAVPTRSPTPPHASMVYPTPQIFLMKRGF